MSKKKIEPKIILIIFNITLIINLLLLVIVAFLGEYLHSITYFAISLLFLLWPCYLISNLLIKYKSKQEFIIKKSSNQITHINNLLSGNNFNLKRYFDNNDIKVFEKDNNLNEKIISRVIIYKPTISSNKEINAEINKIRKEFDKELKYKHNPNKKEYRKSENILLVVFDDKRDIATITETFSEHIFITTYKYRTSNFFIPIAITLKENKIIFGKMIENNLLTHRTIAYEEMKNSIINGKSIFLSLFINSSI